MRRVLSIQESLWIAGERSLWRFGGLPWRLTRVIGRGLGVLSSRGIRWRHGLLSWISASLTRHTVVTTTRTGPTNPCPHQATGSISYLSLLTVCLREVIACLHYLIDFTVWRRLLFGFILSSIMIHSTYLPTVFVLSLHCLLDYGLSSVVYLPLHINRFILSFVFETPMFWRLS